MSLWNLLLKSSFKPLAPTLPHDTRYHIPWTRNPETGWFDITLPSGDTVEAPRLRAHQSRSLRNHSVYSPKDS